MGSFRTWGGARSGPGMGCGRCCCRCSSRCGRSGNWSSRSTTTCCFAGSWAWAWTTWCGTMPCSRRTATVCSRRRWQRFFAEVNERAQPFMSDDEGGDGSNFHGRKRSNDTHESTTDPDARLYKKSYGKESHLAYLGHALVENRNGLIAAAMATQADGYAEREAALLMLKDKQKGCKRRITAGADKAFDSRDFVDAARKLNVIVHVTKNDQKRRSNLDRRTTRHPGYAISLSRRWLVEKGFGWLKQTAPIRQVKLRRLHKVDWLFVFTFPPPTLSLLPSLIAQQHAARFRESCARSLPRA